MDARTNQYTSIIKDMDNLKHSKHEGFYDAEIDMFFRHLEDWLSYKWNKTFSEIF